MKKNLLLIVLAVMVLPLAARAADGTEQKGWNVGLGASISKNDLQEVMFELTPRAGYRINPRWELGGYLQIIPHNYLSEYGHFGIGVFGEYTLLSKWRLRLFIDGKASANIGWGELIPSAELPYPTPTANYETPHRLRSTYYEVGFIPGLAYRFPGSRMELKLRYMYAGFVDSGDWYKMAPGCHGSKSFIFDTGLRRFEFGLAYNF